MIIDRFGNLITDIDHQELTAWLQNRPAERLVAHLNGKQICGMVNSYAEAAHHDSLMIIGSHGYLEIAVGSGSAAGYFEAHRGDRIELSVADPTA